MRVKCPHCGAKAIITSSSAMNDEGTVVDVYATCPARNCMVSFVSTLAYKHTIRQPMKTAVYMAVEVVRRLPIEEREKLK